MFNLSKPGNARQMSGLKLMQFCKFKNCLILHSTVLIVPFRQRSEYLYVGTQTKTSLDFLLEQERNKWLCCPKTNDKSNLLDLSDLRISEGKVTRQTELGVQGWAMAQCWLLLISHHEVHWLEKETVPGQTQSRPRYQHDKAETPRWLCPSVQKVWEQSPAKHRILPHQTESLSRRQNQEWSHPETSRESFKCQHWLVLR